ncbi:MAG TPA: hypothetical protein VLA72_18060 [Anaerolineales bacterium]|nr:hypothetical protein [Anaerolineales bacterium]
MLKTLSKKLYHLSSGYITILALVIFALVVAFVLPAQAQRAEVALGGADSPDTSFFYTSNDLYNMAEAYGADGRAAYIRTRFTFDLIFPLSYLFFLATSISWVMKRAVANPDSRWRLLNLFPVFGTLFDYLENISTSFVMANYPQQTFLFDTLAPIFTLVKWFFVNGSFVILLPAALVALWRYFRNG